MGHENKAVCIVSEGYRDGRFVTCSCVMISVSCRFEDVRGGARGNHGCLSTTTRSQRQKVARSTGPDSTRSRVEDIVEVGTGSL